MKTPKLPVVIAGAGPCGLVAAITLQKEGHQRPENVKVQLLCHTLQHFRLHFVTRV
jgi:2-polyprenyl-6-methoxyphenol hydroxylase-like FAD-dependent oxidoreductase